MKNRAQQPLLFVFLVAPCGIFPPAVLAGERTARAVRACAASFTGSAAPAKQPSSVKSMKIAVPSRTNASPALKNEGWGGGYIRGIDEVNEWIALRDLLRERAVTADGFHIDWFADKMQEQIQFMERGIESPEEKSKMNQLKGRLAKLIEEKKFTYEEWIRGAFSLAGVFDNNEDLIFMSVEEDIEHLLERFPGKMAFPTKTGEMGISALNKAGSHNIHPLGLVRRNKNEFFQHDLTHSKISHHPPSPDFYRTLRETAGNLPLEKRKNIELAYWIMSHEAGFIHGKWFLSPEAARAGLKWEFYENHIENDSEIRGLIDISDREKYDKSTNQVLEDWEAVLSEMLEGSH